ncbi:hypothetical protein QFC19_004009 [Naganishia cerealis]|uniref:Uncharacterized protein n=1 Tax=Naganishia cerealis TaxID=610337 RepID=A0ACC2VZT3_9TREE|nr:hypothetical protein QFC19_004009 [Naganishia cerealis]
MSFLANLVAPYLPGPAQDVIRAIDPLLSLVSNPVNLAWTAYRNPQQILSTLGQTGSNLYTVSRDLDFKSMYADVQHRIQHGGGVSDFAPFIIGALAIFFTFRSLMGTFRYGYRLVGTLVRYGGFLSLLIAAVGWITGAQQQGNQGGLANILGGLGGAGNNNGGNGMANGLFNMAKDYATGAANGQQQGAGNGVWDQAQGLFANVMEGQQQPQAKTGSQRNTRSTKQRAARENKAASTQNNGGNGDLSDIAQGWVKDALLKATGLDSLFGGGVPDNKQNAKSKENGGTGAKTRRNAAR